MSSQRTSFLIVAALISAAASLPNCMNDETGLPAGAGASGDLDNTGGSSGDTGNNNGGTGGGSAGSGTGGSTTDPNGNGGSIGSGGSVGVGGSGGSSGGTAGSGGGGHAGSGGGGAGGTAGSAGGGGGVDLGMGTCNTVKLDCDDKNHVSSNLTDLKELINKANGIDYKDYCQDFTAAACYVLAATGGGGHTHIVQFKAADIKTLRSGGMVSGRTTKTEGGDHTYSVTCTN